MTPYSSSSPQNLLNDVFACPKKLKVDELDGFWIFRKFFPGAQNFKKICKRLV